MLIWMSSWGDRLQRYHSNGVRGVGMWGDWQGASIWPDCQPGYLVVADGRDCNADPVSWRIPQDKYYSSIVSSSQLPRDRRPSLGVVVLSIDRCGAQDAFPRTAAEAEVLASESEGTPASEPPVPWRAGDAMLYLGSQLAFDPTQNVSALAHEYATTVFGADDAAAGEH